METFSSVLMLVRDVHRGGGGSKGAGILILHGLLHFFRKR